MATETHGSLSYRATTPHGLEADEISFAITRFLPKAETSEEFAYRGVSAHEAGTAACEILYAATRPARSYWGRYPNGTECNMIRNYIRRFSSPAFTRLPRSRDEIATPKDALEPTSSAGSQRSAVHALRVRPQSRQLITP